MRIHHDRARFDATSTKSPRPIESSSGTATNAYDWPVVSASAPVIEMSKDILDLVDQRWFEYRIEEGNHTIQ
ncbi:MAG: hypothetical protein R3B46_11775 [Phycisphaerales bacterium]